MHISGECEECHSYPYARPNADARACGHADAAPHSDANARAYRDLHPRSVAYCHGHPYAHPYSYVHTDADACAYGHTDAAPHSDAFPYSHAYGYTDRRAHHTDRHSAAEADAHRATHANAENELRRAAAGRHLYHRACV